VFIMPPGAAVRQPDAHAPVDPAEEPGRGEASSVL